MPHHTHSLHRHLRGTLHAAALEGDQRLLEAWLRPVAGDAAAGDVLLFATDLRQQATALHIAAAHGHTRVV